MPMSHHDDFAERLNRLRAQLRAAMPSRPRRGRGRPDLSIRSGYARIEAYLPADVHDALDRLVDRREVQTGKSTRRADVIRDGLTEYLQNLMSCWA